jgi:hypothetical protein
VLAGIVGASVQGRVALGRRAGARVRRLGDERDTVGRDVGRSAAGAPGGLRSARQPVSVGEDLRGWSGCVDYVLRPAFAQERLRLLRDGRIALELKTAWESVT